MKSLDNIYTWFVIHLMENGLEPFANIDSIQSTKKIRKKSNSNNFRPLTNNSVEDNLDENDLAAYRQSLKN